MTPETYGMLQEWIKTGNEAQRQHAAYRLSLPDAIDYKPILMEYPSLFQQAKNVAQAVGSVVGSMVRGEPVTVPQEEQDRRLSVCLACEFWDGGQERCSKCGCFGQWKTWLATQRCPIGKW
jgi:hypothetical protein